MTIKHVLADLDSASYSLETNNLLAAAHKLGVLRGRILAELAADEAHRRAMLDFVALIEGGVATGKDS